MNRGFTLTEIIVVVSILGIISAMAYAGFSNFVVSSKLDSVGENVFSLINKTREKTVASEGGIPYGVRVEESKLVLFRAPTYVEWEPSNEEYVLPADFFISSINLEGGVNDVLFLPLTGETIAFGTLTVERRGYASVQKIIRIYETGIVEIE